MLGPAQRASRLSPPRAGEAQPAQPAPPAPHVACVRVHHPRHPWASEARDHDADGEAWLAACYHVTPRLERVSATCALLDLGSCTDDEAAAVAEHLLQRLAALAGGQTPARIGVGTSALSAQLALSQPRQPAGRQPRATRDEAPIGMLTAAETPAAIRALAVRQLPALHPAGTVTEEAVERLEGYGLRTLGQVARLREAALRRQFGERVGAALAALAAGRDLRPLVPTPRPPTLRCRLAFPSGASAERALAALGLVAERLARRLTAEDRQARGLRLALIWQTGEVRAGHVRLRMPTAEARVCAQQLRDLYRTLLLGQTAPGGHAEEDGDTLATSSAAIERMLVEVGDLVPLTPAQATFWRTAAQRQAAVDQVAEALVRRFGRQPRLVHAPCALPHAIIPIERYRWLPVRPMDETDETETLNHPPSRPPGDQDSVRDSMRDVASAGMGAGSPWEGVPHRLHWW